MTSTTALEHVNRFKRSDKVRRIGERGTYVVLDRAFEGDIIKVRDAGGLVWWASSHRFELAPDEHPAFAPGLKTTQAERILAAYPSNRLDGTFQVRAAEDIQTLIARAEAAEAEVARLSMQERQS